MGYDIPRLSLDKRNPTRSEAEKLGIPRKPQVAAEGIKVVRDIALDESAEPYVRLAAGAKLVDYFGADSAFEVQAPAMSASELLDSVREALPELERRAAQENASRVAIVAVSCEATVQVPADEKGPQQLEELNPWESIQTDS